jgi:PAS domain S-box-containing protein
MITDWRTTLARWLDTHNTDPLQLRHGRLLALFLLAASAMSVILLLIDLTEFFTGVVKPLWSIIDAGLLVCLLGLFVLNRRGKVRLAAYGALGLMISATTVLMPLDTLNDSLVLYALPIVVSSFVVSPAASLGTAVMVAAAYCLMNLLHQADSPFNCLGVLALFVLSITIWTVADWLQRALQQAQAAAIDLRADIAERERAEAALRVSEERYRQLVQNVGEGIGVVDLNEVFVFANAATEQLFGVAPGRLVGRSISEFVTAEQLRTIQAQTERRREGVTSSYEIAIVQPNGRACSLLLTGSPQLDAAGQLIGVLGIFHDITARKHAEAALIASEERARTLAHQLQAINAQLEDYYSDALTVHEVSRALAAALDQTAIYRLLYREVAQRLLGAAHLLVARYDNQTQLIHYGYAVVDGQEADLAQFPTYALGAGPVSDTIRTRKACMVDLAVMLAELAPQGRAVRIGDPDDQPPLSAMYAPLIRAGQVIGVLNVQHDAPGAFSERQLRLIATIANQAAVALTNAELFATLEQRVADRTVDLQAVNQALRDSEERLRAVSEATPIPLLITRLSDTAILSANTPLCEMIGLPREQLIGQAARNFVLDQRTFRRLVLEIYRRGSVQNAEVEIVEATGKRFWVVVAMRRMTFGDEPALVTGFYDVTERKRIERDLRDSEARFRQIAENIREVFWMSVPDKSQVLYVSPAYEETLGRTCASLYDDPASYFEAVHPDDRPKVDAYLDQQRQGLPAFAEYRIIRPDGAIGWIGDRAFPVRDETGRLYRIAGVAEDVTSRKQAEAELHRALQIEKELVELKSRFISMTSHEFRTPLAGILIAAELLEHYGHKWPDSKKLHYLRQIQTSVKNMTLLLEEVLFISRGEAHRIEFHPAPLELDQFCRDLVEEVQLSQLTHTIGYTSTVDGCRPALDEQLLRRILINLLSNAVKYSPDAGAIEFEVTASGDQFVFRVTDHGLGIPPEARARLFENFFRAGNVAGIPGTGLGLSIVKQAVELHGGSIQYTSVLNQGTTFVVTLPASSAPTQESTHVSENSGH